MVHVVSVQYVNLIAGASKQNIFKIPSQSRDMAGKKGGSLEFHANEK